MVNIPLGKNAPFRKIYFGAIIPINNAVTQSDKKVYIRVCLFSCHCCKLLFANKKSNAPSTKPLASEGIERFSTKPATPLPATIIAHGYVTQKSYIIFFFPLRVCCYRRRRSRKIPSRWYSLLVFSLLLLGVHDGAFSLELFPQPGATRTRLKTTTSANVYFSSLPSSGNSALLRVRYVCAAQQL